MGPGLLRLRIIIMVALALPIGSATVHGQPVAKPSAAELAGKHFERGKVQYDLGHFDQAIVEFERGYELKPAPAFLLNLAQAHRLKGDKKRALFFYRRFLSARPDFVNRAEVEEWIAKLQSDIAAERLAASSNDDEEGSDSESVPATETTPPPVSEPRATQETITTAGSKQHRPARKFRFGAEAGFAKVDFGSEAEAGTVQFAMSLSGAYEVYSGKVRVYAGGTGTFTTVSPESDSAGDATTNVFSALANASLFAPLSANLDLRFELGTGLLLWNNLSEGNPWTMNGREESSLAFWNTRFAVGLDYDLTNLLSLTATPLAVSYNPKKAIVGGDASDLAEQVDFIFRLELMSFGVSARF